MDTAQIRSSFTNVATGRYGEPRAPHEPLLLLYALGGVRPGEPRLVPYARADEFLAWHRHAFFRKPARARAAA